MGGQGLEIIKGTLDILILRTLSRAPNHGYGIARWLEDNSSQAFQVEEGALYPALRRMEKRELLVADWGVTDTGREAKFYRLTSLGERELEAAREKWDRYATAMAQVLGLAGKE
jgi:transcriptional regulator